jgi:hypothetical protein
MSCRYHRNQKPGPPAEVNCSVSLAFCTTWNPFLNMWVPYQPGIPKPPNPIEDPSTKDKVCNAAAVAATYFGFVAGPGALSSVAAPSIITGGLTTAGEVGGFVIAPEVAVPLFAIGVPGLLLLCIF